MPAGTTERASESTGPADDTAVARAAWGSVYALVFSPQSRDRMHDACEALGLTPGLMRALFSIEPGAARPMRELAGEWHCDASYVTSVIDGLEERGLVERRAHPSDRRAKMLVLTDSGEHTRAALFARIHEPPPYFAALSSDEARQLRDLLAKLVAAALADPPAAHVHH